MTHTRVPPAPGANPDAPGGTPATPPPVQGIPVMKTADQIGKQRERRRAARKGTTATMYCPDPQLLLPHFPVDDADHPVGSEAWRKQQVHAAIRAAILEGVWQPECLDLPPGRPDPELPEASEALKALLKAHSLRAVTYAGLTYYPNATEWDSVPWRDALAGPHDPPMPCKGYFECDYPPPTIRAPAEDIGYVLSTPEGSKPSDHLARLKAWLPFESDAECRLSLPILGVTGICFVNEGGPNEDHRGSDHFAIGLDCSERWRVPLPATPSQLAEGLLRVKSHKNNNWYVLFLGVTDETIEGDTLTVHLRFDHGS